MLTTLGLDSVGETVYRAMLRQPAAGVAALADSVGVPEEQVREALDTLSELALVRPAAGDAGRLRAVSPDIGMEILMARQQAQLAAHQQRLEASRAAAAQLISEYAELRPATSHPDVEQLVGLDHIRDRLAVLTREVSEEFLAFAPGGPQTAENMAASRPLNQDLLARGVRMRTIYLDSVRTSKPTVEHADWLARLGGQVRTVPSLPTRMILMDRRIAMISVNSDDTAMRRGPPDRAGHTHRAVRALRGHLGGRPAARAGRPHRSERAHRPAGDRPAPTGRGAHRRGDRQAARGVASHGPADRLRTDGPPRRTQPLRGRRTRRSAGLAPDPALTPGSRTDSFGDT